MGQREISETDAASERDRTFGMTCDGGEWYVETRRVVYSSEAPPSQGGRRGRGAKMTSARAVEGRNRFT
jgi:hypothetical protein